jgi:hypothetical protein
MINHQINLSLLCDNVTIAIDIALQSVVIPERAEHSPSVRINSLNFIADFA